MTRLATVLVAGVLAVIVAGCGEDEAMRSSGSEPGTTQQRAPAPEPEPEPRGTTVTLGDSDFGSMLFDRRKQAIYIFENDAQGRSACYGECAEAWPPVYTEGEPRAGDGVRQELLGTTERRDGRLQVTYAGKPLYLYAHEGPGEVRCHDVDLNGGFWWVVGADGKRRP